uniref:X8 domain-containing protein n=1 Tax=Leersia perrieri TaxID=77586 RepID=A0A0D9WVG9_9ORYZ
MSSPVIPTTHPALRHCVALLRLHLSSPSLSAAKQLHARALRGGVPLSNPLLAKHLLFHLASLPSQEQQPLLRYAVAVLTRLRLPHPDPFPLNTVLRIAASSPRPRVALSIHRRRLAPPDTHTYPPLLQACARLLALRDGERIHAEATKNGFATLVFVRNSLVHLYGACGLFESAHRVFDEMPVRGGRNLVSWNSMLNGFAANGRPNEVLTVFREMMGVDFAPDGFTVVSVMTACAEIGALALGRRVHVYVEKVGLVDNSHVSNALIDLYAKCGSVDDARRVFEEMGLGRTVVSWTSLIVGLAANGFGKEALELFGVMEREKLVPTEITMVGVLYACSHCGLVDDGLRYFDRMKEDYGIAPRIEHLGCMVDLLGRAGRVEEAYDYIIKMPLEPNAVVWRTLLGACAMHKKLEFGKLAWARLVELDPGHSGDYVLLSNLYAAVGRWADVHVLRKTMVKNRVRKNPGHSLVELQNSVYEFVMGDRSHPESEQIYEMLADIAERLRREGYIPRTSNVLADIEEEEKETALNYHSERLAIAFALLKSLPGIPIRIIKNLRMCGDCHVAIKLISKVYNREIIVRDRTSAAGARFAPQEKAESSTPIPTLSPPEGNMTFVDGVTWCVARPGVSQEDLQNALDWACGLGGADCTPLQPGGRCYQPDTLLSHASYAFNIFYQQNGNSDIACNFGGAGTISKRDPSFGSCKFLASETSAASALTRGSMWAICAVALPLIIFHLRVFQSIIYLCKYATSKEQW